MAKKNFKFWLIGLIAVAGLAVGSGSLARQFSKEKTKELSSSDYSIGAVTDAGTFDKEDKTSITSDEYKVKDLVSIEVDEGAPVNVYVHWYNEDDEFISSTEVTGGEIEAPEGAETFRAEIVPTEDEDGKITIFEKGGYADYVTVTLKK